MKLQLSPFEKIKNGSKTIEIRLNDEKRQRINIGDEIEFSLVSDSSQKILTIVKGLYHFKTFKELYYAFNPSEYGNDDKDEYMKMYQYYSKENEVKYGVLGVRVKMV